MYAPIILLNPGFQLASVMGIVNAQRKIDVETAKITLMVRAERFSQKVQLVKCFIAYLVFLPPPPPLPTSKLSAKYWSVVNDFLGLRISDHLVMMNLY